MTLKDLTQNVPAKVAGLRGPHDFVERLMEMGFYRGCVVKVRTRLPMGGPLIVEAGSLVIAVREAEAQSIDVMV